MQSYRIPRKGFARGDCVLYAENVSGVKRAYPYAADDSDIVGSSRMYIESTLDSGFATPELIELVKMEIDSKIPLADCAIIIETIITTSLTVTIEGYTGVSADDDDDEKNAIKTSIENYFKNIRPFLDGVDRSTTKNDTIKRVDLSGIVLDALETYSGFITDAYWNAGERTKTVQENEIFRLSTVVYL